MFNVSNDGDDYIYFEIDGPNNESSNRTGVSGQDYVVYDNFSPGSGNSGDYTVTATAEDNESETKEFVIDISEPEITKGDDKEFVEDNPNIDFTVSDEFSAVTSLSIDTFDVSVDDSSRSDVCGSGGECTVSFDVDTDDVSQGDTFTVDLTAEDEVGNEVTEGFEYTLDDSFEADTPEFSVEGADGDNDVLMTDEEVSVDVTVSGMDDETSDVRVSCLVDGDETDNSPTDWSSDEDFSCDLSEDEVGGETVDVSVEACDEAGNCEESDTRSYTFDSSPPLLESFSTSTGYDVFSDDFNVEFEATDSGTGVESAEYFFSSAILQGNGNEVDLDGDSEFQIDTSEIPDPDEESQTVYMRVRDGVGQWSDYRSIDFDYRPEATHTASLSAEENFSVRSGGSGVFEVTVENTGDLLIRSMNVTVSSNVVSGERTVEELEGEESRTLEFDTEPNESQIGEWQVDLESDDPRVSESVNITVRANEEQREEVDSMLENYSSSMDSLSSNITDLRREGLDAELNETLSENVTPFKHRVKSAQEFVDEGEYYRAYSALENIEELEETAKSTFSDVKQEHEINQRNSLLLMLFGGFIVVAAGAGAFVYTREDYKLGLDELNLDEYRVPDLGGISSAVSEKIQALGEKIEEEEEEVEQKFEGFS